MCNLIVQKKKKQKKTENYIYSSAFILECKK